MDANPSAEHQMAAKMARLTALEGLPLVRPGDDIAAIILTGLNRNCVELDDGDIVVIAQKVISKAENRFLGLAGITPSPKALELARTVGKDARLVQVILDQSRRVVRHRAGVLIVEHQLGYVMANAGVDGSNLEPLPGGEPQVLLLPENPDKSAEAVRARLGNATGKRLAVIINDSVGRAWRVGTIGMALGVAGMMAVRDDRGRNDLFGRPLATTQVGLADEVASAASLLQGQADEGRPVVIIRGVDFVGDTRGGSDLIRDGSHDLFR